MLRKISYLVVPFIAALALLCCVFAFPYFAPPRMKARVWHLFHRNTVAVGSYRIPVPPDWYVETFPEMTRIVDSRTADWITAQSRSDESFDAWSQSIHRYPLATNVHLSGDRRIKVSDVTWLCVQRTLDNARRLFENADCRTTPESGRDALEITFTAMQPGNLLDQGFYPFLRTVGRER